MLDIRRGYLRVTEKTASQRIKDRLDEVFHVQRSVTVVSRVKTEGKGNSETIFRIPGFLFPLRFNFRCHLHFPLLLTFPSALAIYYRINYRAEYGHGRKNTCGTR